MRIGTAEADSTFMSQGLALKRLLEESGAALVEVLATPVASTRNVMRLQSGEIEFGLMAANWLGRAREGRPPFKRPVDLRVVAPMNAGPMFFVATAASGLTKAVQLRGRRVAVGPAAGGTAQHANAILGALGIGAGAFEPIHLDFREGAEALAQGAIDAQLQRPIPNAIMSALDARADVCVLAYEKEELADVLAANPTYRRTLMPAGALRGLREDCEQAAVLNVLVAHARCAPDLAREVAAACVEGAEKLGRLNALFAGLPGLFRSLAAHGRGWLEFEGVFLHDGALRAYREAGLI